MTPRLKAFGLQAVHLEIMQYLQKTRALFHEKEGPYLTRHVVPEYSVFRLTRWLRNILFLFVSFSKNQLPENRFMWMVSPVEILLIYSPHISGSLLDVSSNIVISRIFFMPTGMYGVSKRCPSQQHFFTRLV